LINVTFGNATPCATSIHISYVILRPVPSTMMSCTELSCWLKKLLKQGYVTPRLKSLLQKFYRHHHELVDCCEIFIDFLDVLDTKLVDKVCQWLAVDRWFFPPIKLKKYCEFGVKHHYNHNPIHFSHSNEPFPFYYHWPDIYLAWLSITAVVHLYFCVLCLMLPVFFNYPFGFLYRLFPVHCLCCFPHLAWQPWYNWHIAENIIGLQ
jgi:hypothetical protein